MRRVAEQGQVAVVQVVQRQQVARRPEVRTVEVGGGDRRREFGAPALQEFVGEAREVAAVARARRAVGLGELHELDDLLVAGGQQPGGEAACRRVELAEGRAQGAGEAGGLGRGDDLLDHDLAELRVRECLGPALGVGAVAAEEGVAGQLGAIVEDRLGVVAVVVARESDQRPAVHAFGQAHRRLQPEQQRLARHAHGADEALSAEQAAAGPVQFDAVDGPAQGSPADLGSQLLQGLESVGQQQEPHASGLVLAAPLDQHDRPPSRRGAQASRHGATGDAAA